MVKIFLLFSISFFISINTYADLQDALQAYEKQNYESAHKQFMQLAEVGNADAFYKLGIMNFKGQFVDKDYQQAYAWMRLAHQVDGFFALRAVEKKLNDEEFILAEKIFETLNDSYGILIFESNFMPKFNITKEFIYDETSPKPLVKYAPIFPKRAASNGVPGIVIVGFRINPNGKVSDIGLISEYPRKYNFAKNAINSTHKFEYEQWDESVEGAKQYYYMFNVFKFDTRMPIQQKDKFDRLVTSANDNNANAQFALANYIIPNFNVVSTEYPKVNNKRNKFEIPEMKAEGNQLLLSSAMNGNHEAQAYLGMRLLIGRDVEKDEEKAINWLQQAAANGSKYAEKQIAQIESEK